MPRGIPKMKTEAADIAQPKALDMPTTGPLAGMVRTDQEIVIVNEMPEMDEYAKKLAFMEEPVEVLVHESTEENPDLIVDLYCNGVPQRFIRGVPVTVKRKYVEILANARTERMKTNVVREGDAVYNRVNKHSALRYPFQMTDPNPRGQDWLKGLLGKTS
jgi:hypothetical protein